MIKDNPKLLPNYDGHTFTSAGNPRFPGFNRTLVLTNNGKFNPNGGWLTPRAMGRWIDTYVQPQAQTRMHNWVDMAVIFRA